MDRSDFERIKVKSSQSAEDHDLPLTTQVIRKKIRQRVAHQQKTTQLLQQLVERSLSQKESRHPSHTLIKRKIREQFERSIDRKQFDEQIQHQQKEREARLLTNNQTIATYYNQWRSQYTEHCQAIAVDFQEETLTRILHELIEPFEQSQPISTYYADTHDYGVIALQLQQELEQLQSQLHSTLVQHACIADHPRSIVLVSLLDALALELKECKHCHQTGLSYIPLSLHDSAMTDELPEGTQQRLTHKINELNQESAAMTAEITVIQEKNQFLQDQLELIYQCVEQLSITDDNYLLTLLKHKDMVEQAIAAGRHT